MTKLSRSWKEGAGIYDVLENRGKLSNHSAWDMVQKGGIYGWAHRNDKIVDKLKYKFATQGLIAGITSFFDYSGGGYFWQGNDFAKHYDGMHTYEDFYLVGFKFTKT